MDCAKTLWLSLCVLLDFYRVIVDFKGRFEENEGRFGVKYVYFVR